jgi:hypothetical protein
VGSIQSVDSTSSSFYTELTFRMRVPAFTSFAILAATVTQLVPGSIAWERDQAAQMNFYTDTQCTQFAGTASAWWSKSPLVGTVVDPNRAQCITLNMPGNAQSMNSAAFWPFSVTSEPARMSGFCTVFDDVGCKGNSARSTYVPFNGFCLRARSVDGWLWKSARCVAG